MTKDSSLPAKLILAFGLLIAIVVGVGVVSLRHIEADAELERIVDARWEKVQLSRQAQSYSNLNNRITMQVFLVESESGINTLLVETAKNSEKISGLIETLRTRVEAPEERQLLNKIEEKRTPYLETYRRALRLLVVDKEPAEARAVLTQEALPLLLKYHDSWNAYASYQGAQLDRAQERTSTINTQTRLQAFVLISFVVILAIFIAYFVTHNLTTHMARRKRAEEALRRSRDELEARVQKRTAELASANEGLKREIAEKRSVEAALRGSEERYRQIVECANDTIYRISLTGYFTFVNQSAAALVKRSENECVGLHFTELIRDDYREKTLAFYAQQIEDKVPITYFEFPAIAKDGTEVWIGQNVQLVAENGRVVELQGIARDVTTQREIEQQLLESERHYRLLFESNPQSMWVFDMETLRFLAVNDAAVHHYGYSRDEFLGMTIKEIRPAEDVDNLMSVLTASVGEFGDVSDGMRHRKKDGGVIDVEVSWHALNFSGRPAKLVLANDVTERKRAEATLAQERILLRTVIDNLPDAVYVKDAAGRKVLANRADLENIGKPGNEVIGKTDWDVYPADVAGQFDPDDRAVLHEGQTVINHEELLVNARGQSRWLLTSKLPLQDSQGRITGLVGIGHDITEYKKAEEALAGERNLLRTLIDELPDRIYVKDEQCRFLVNNKSHIAALGAKSQEEVLGRTDYDFRPAEFADQFFADDQKVVTSGKPMINREEHTISASGETGLLLVTKVPLRNAEGKVIGLVGISRDITDRKRAEQEILIQTARFQQLFENTPMGIVVVDENDIVLDANKEFENIFGFSLSEVRGQHINESIVPGDQGKEGAELSAKTLQGEAIEKETVRQRQDGTLIPVQVYGVPIIANQKTVGVFAIYVDLSQRKRMEAEREVIAEIIQGAITTSDLDEFFKLAHHAIGKYLDADNCFVALYDEATELMQFPFWVDKLDPCPEPRPVGIGFSSYVLRTGKPILVDRELTEEMYQRGEVQKSGSASASWLGVPLRTPSRIIGVLVVQHYEEEDAYDERDLEFLTSVGSQIALAIERKRAETNLREAEDRLRQSQKMESIGNLAGGIAHDFNNLMTAVTGYSELALRSAKLDESLRFKVEEIKKAGERAASLTRQLLAFSRKQMLQPKVLDLNTVVTGMGKMLALVISEDIDLRFSLDDSLGQIKADPGQIEQVLLNLAVNARDAMPAGGALTIKTENVHLNGKLTQSHFVTEPGHYVMMSVSDTGCGMDAETRSHIFEPFFTTKEVGKGTGLGLATVYGIVKQSGGNIWVYSELGKGAIFKIYLPRVDEIVDEATNDSESRAAVRGEETILLVEDEEVVRKLACEILQTYGYSVLTAANGSEGLRLGREFEGPIDLVITDVIMPLMSGREMAEKLRNIRPNLGVIFMSGFTDDAIVHHGVLDESMFFIQKPFSPDALATMARQVLDHVSANQFPAGLIPNTSRVVEPESAHSVN